MLWARLAMGLFIPPGMLTRSSIKFELEIKFFLIAPPSRQSLWECTKE
jgi:hypothetical protein